MLARLPLSWEILWSLKRTISDIIYDLFSSQNQHWPLSQRCPPSTLPVQSRVQSCNHQKQPNSKIHTSSTMESNSLREIAKRGNDSIYYEIWMKRSFSRGHPWGAPTRIFILARDRGEDKTRKRISNELRLKTKLTFSSSCAICAREKCLRIAAKKVLTRCDIS